MASHMGVQTFATERNSHAEFFVHVLLEMFGQNLLEKNKINKYHIESQSKYISEIASDVWDHKLSLINNEKTTELWCQTTCYKGNKKGIPEPNKTYEVRETLVEGISIREYFAKAKSDCRSIHFTVGEKKYTYQWFLDLKESTYDKSFYLGEENLDILSEITKVLGQVFTEEDKKNALYKEITNDTILGKTISKTINALAIWWETGLTKSSLADKQWALVSNELAKMQKLSSPLNKKGINIKGRVNAIVFEKELNKEDPLIIKTAIELLSKKPFLKVALEATSDWDTFCLKFLNITLQSNTYLNAIIALWSDTSLNRLIIRRLLLRIHTTDSIAYVQDLNVDGISEHNLYHGDHNQTQTKMISTIIHTQLLNNKINNLDELLKAVKNRGKNLINSARWFEAKNGTSLKPSFDYVELALQEAGYKILKPSKQTLQTIGYHSELSKESVKAYTNLKLVADKNNNILCILKGKFFRDQEFPRRCKEEAFVSLSLKFTYLNSNFEERFPNIPLIMFVDMNTGCNPPLHALNRLMAFGWKPFFNIEDLVADLKQVSAK